MHLLPGELATQLSSELVWDNQKLPEPSKRVQLLDRKSLQADIKALSQLSPIKMSAVIFWHWSIIVFMFWLTIYTGNILVYLVSALIVMARKQALGLLMHEGTHYLVSKNRAVNDFVSDIFFAFPLGVSTQFFREFHFQHHKNLGVENHDAELNLKEEMPERWTFPMSRKMFLSLILRDLLGLTLNEWGRFVGILSPWHRLRTDCLEAIKTHPWIYARFFIYYGVLLTLLTVYNLWLPFLILWILPSLSILPVLFRLRTIGEHAAADCSNELQTTRTLLLNPIEKFFIAPCGINYHLEHHLFPSIPCYNLGKLHNRLMKEEVFRKRAHITKGYFHPTDGLFAEVLKN